MQVVLSWIAIGGEEGLRARSTLLLAREAEEVLATGLEVGRGREGGMEGRREGSKIE